MFWLEFNPYLLREVQLLKSGYIEIYVEDLTLRWIHIRIKCSGFSHEEVLRRYSDYLSWILGFYICVWPFNSDLEGYQLKPSLNWRSEAFYIVIVYNYFLCSCHFENKAKFTYWALFRMSHFKFSTSPGFWSFMFENFKGSQSITLCI